MNKVLSALFLLCLLLLVGAQENVEPVAVADADADVPAPSQQDPEAPTEPAQDGVTIKPIDNCGNGQIDAGEECDAGNDTPCCKKCKLTPGSQCATGECCEKCMFKPTTSICGDGGNFCQNGKCLASKCAPNSNLLFCGVKETNPCQETCSKKTNPGTCYLLSKFGLNGQVPDGVVCGVAPYSVCNCGECEEAPTWVPDDWTECSEECGGGKQTRNVTCQMSDGTPRPETECKISKPLLSRECNIDACPTGTSAPSSLGTNELAGIIAGAVGGALFLIASIIGAHCYRKKRNANAEGKVPGPDTEQGLSDPTVTA